MLFDFVELGNSIREWDKNVLNFRTNASGDCHPPLASNFLHFVYSENFFEHSISRIRIAITIASSAVSGECPEKKPSYNSRERWTE